MDVNQPLQETTATVDGFKRERRQADDIADALYAAGYADRAAKMYNCATYITLAEDKIVSALFCQQRICPLCSWRRRVKICKQFADVYDHIDKDGANFILLTLTVPNVIGDDLSSELDNMQRAWVKLTRSTEFTDAVISYMYSIEVSLGESQRGETMYHPHLHAIVMLDDSKPAPNWFRLWRLRVGRMVSENGVNVKPFTVKLNQTERENALDVVSYVAKGVIKSTEADNILRFSNLAKAGEVFETIAKAIHGRRLIAYGGKFADVRRELNADDDLDNIDVNDVEKVKSSDAALKLIYLRYDRAKRDYVVI